MADSNYGTDQIFRDEIIIKRDISTLNNDEVVIVLKENIEDLKIKVNQLINDLAYIKLKLKK